MEWIRAAFGFVSGGKATLIVAGALGAALVMLFLLFQGRGARIEALEAEKARLADANAAQKIVIDLQVQAAAGIDRVTGHLDRLLERQGRDFNDIRTRIAGVAKAGVVACGPAVSLALDELRRRNAGRAPGGQRSDGAGASAPLPGAPGGAGARPAGRPLLRPAGQRRDRRPGRMDGNLRGAHPRARRIVAGIRIPRPLNRGA
ncbi:MAG: hypothetical protein AB7F36_01720 [Reyranellaceae bacterium]